MEHKILFISMRVPFDTVGHAGGKTHNYYLKSFSNDSDFNVKLITFGMENEKNKIDLDEYKIDYKVFFNSRKFLSKLKRRLVFELSIRFDFIDKYAGMVNYSHKQLIINYLKKLKKTGYNPDIIILEWTQIVLMVSYIKKVFPNCKYVASEHDVSYLSFYRKYKYETNKVKRVIKFIKYKNLKKSELNCLKQIDLVVPHNTKDKDLLLKENLDLYSKVDFINPFYSDMSSIIPLFNKNNIIFFGAMSRPENYKSCIVFIKNVFNKLLEIDTTFKFYIVGGNPNKELLKYASKNIIITGFVENIRPYFENSLCMVAPLILGAGIKVKILEGMSSGIPVLTNQIGIEGIPAQKDKDYIFCNNDDDYVKNIIELNKDTQKARFIGDNGRKFINQNFNLEKSYNNYKYNVLQLLKEK